MDDDYELIPRSKIDELKHEVENYKNPSDHKDVKYDSVKKIDEKLDLLIEIFKSAKSEAKNLDFDEKIDEVNKKVTHVEEELKKVTQALVVLARMIKNPQDKQNTQNHQTNNDQSQINNSNSNQSQSNNNNSDQTSNINNPPTNKLNQMPPPPPPIKTGGLFSKK